MAGRVGAGAGRQLRLCEALLAVLRALRSTAQYRNDPFGGAKPPRLFAEVVRRVHAQGLPVAVCIETAADFPVAVRAGTDEINYLPGYF